MEGEALIILTKDTSSVDIDVPGSVLCVYHERYAAPTKFKNAIPWKHFESEFSRLVDSAETLVLVGLNRIITPANRVRVGAMVLRPRKWKRVSIDHTLFRSEPWRAWFHFGCVQAPYYDYSYSYLAESDWRGFIDGVRDCNYFSLEKILEAGAGVIRSDYSEYFCKPEIVVHTTTSAQKDEYQDAKVAAFEEEHTLPAIVRRLSSFAQNTCDERKIPDVSRLFDKEKHRIVMTDLAIDTFLVNRLRSLMAITNGIANGTH